MERWQMAPACGAVAAGKVGRWAWALLLWALLCASSWAQEPQAQPAGAQAPQTLRVYSRSITTFASGVGGYSARDRALAAGLRIEHLLQAQPNAEPSSELRSQGMAILLGGQLAFYLREADVDSLAGETLEQRAQDAVRALELVRSDRSTLHDSRSMASAAAIVVGASLALVLGLKLLWRLRRWVLRRLRHWMQPAVRLAGVVAGHRVRLLVRWLYRSLALAFVLLALALCHAWLSVVLYQIPYTRAWSGELNTALLVFAQRSLWAVLEALPNLLIALTIALAARYASRFIHYLFGRIERGELVLALFDRDTATTTRRLLSFAVWVFALAMAYPYLPGAQTEAFKGLSVMIGLMVSLGASSLVGQFASGLILIYSRALKVGEYVQIGGVEGTVAHIGLFSTKIHTNLREEVNIPNSGLVGQNVKNYSRLVSGGGVITSVAVSIGYDTPWRQVEAMLLQAAAQTPGVRAEPAPKVYQTALADWYVEYQLRVAVDEPWRKSSILHLLHGQVQDVFNEYGVQIMSPHYIADPEQEKLVPPARRAPPPA